MTTSRPMAPIRGRRIRVTRLDECSAPVIGPATTHVSKGFSTIENAPNYEDGTDITVPDAMGDFDVNEPGDPFLTYIESTITLTRVDPDLVCLITGYPTVLDFEAAAVGFRMEGGVPILGGWALETWSDLAGQVCSTTGEREYGYTLMPFFRGGKVNNWTTENGAASFSIVSKTREGSLWGVGPYNVVPVDETNTAGKLLQPIGPKTHLHMQSTSIAPPVPAAGLTALAAPTP